LIRLRSLSKVGGDQPIGGPRVQNVGREWSPPVPMVVAPMSRSNEAIIFPS